MSQCPPGTYLEGDTCYTNCANPYNGRTYIGGLTGKTGTCMQNCTGETKESGVFCSKNFYARPTGVLPTTCPTGQELFNGVCYNKCPSGFKRTSACECTPTTPSGYVWGMTNCNGPKLKPMSMGPGITGWSDCIAFYTPITNPTYCAGSTAPTCGTQDAVNGLCYPQCNTGYAKNGTMCGSICPADMNDLGGSCVRGMYVPPPLGGVPRYGLCSTPVSEITPLTKYTPIDTQDLALNSVYSGAASIGKGCVENDTTNPFGIFTIDGGLGYLNAIAKGFTFNTNEFDFALGDSCNLCANCTGKECIGSAITGARPSVKRKAYTGDAINCCISGGKLDGAKTCDPKYRSTNPTRDTVCGPLLDSYCDIPTNFSKTNYCQTNYSQIPYATNGLTSFSECSRSCGTGSQSRSCNVSQDTAGSVKALRKTILNKTFMSDRDPQLESTPDNDSKYYIFKDNCKGELLEQPCNTQSCAFYEQRSPGEILIAFLIICAIIFGIWSVSSSSKSLEKKGGEIIRSSMAILGGLFK